LVDHEAAEWFARRRVGVVAGEKTLYVRHGRIGDLAMAFMVGELYEALRLAQVPGDEARAAATAVADFERRIGRIETLVSVNTVVLAMNTGLVIAIAGRSFQFFQT
jgi:hypothetical protein